MKVEDPDAGSVPTLQDTVHTQQRNMGMNMVINRRVILSVQLRIYFYNMINF